MRRRDLKGRTIKFHSKKNDRVIVVSSELARAYCRYLEEDRSVMSYEPDYALDEYTIDTISHAEIRKDFYEKAWVTDFYIKKLGGVIAVRELVDPQKLSQLAEIEKMELSRRYWAAKGVTDWKLIFTDAWVKAGEED